MKKRNPWQPYKDRIAELEQQLREKQTDDDIRRFFDDYFYPMLGAYLGTTHYSKWPEILQTVLREAGRQAPTVLYFFKKRHDENIKS